MYNSVIAEVLKQKFGNEKFQIYCEMEVEKHEIEKQLDNEYYSLEASYEEFFWKAKLEELKQKENH